uniref:Tetraspanin n=1 Tax=Macrostomum lignano TaxID=282301 RepID=A0A1I8GTU6_9PLAT
LLGLLLAVLGAILLWGYAVIQSVASSYIASLSAGFRTTFGTDINLQAYIEGMANITGSAAGILIGFGVLLVIYMVCVALLLIGQLIVVIIWFADSNIMKRSVRTTMDRQVEVYTGEQNSNFETITLNLLQTLVGCCGVNNGSDFNFSKNWNRTFTITDKNDNTSSVTFNLTYPVTCCKFNTTSFTLQDQYCPYNGTTATSNYEVGCYNKVFQLVETYASLNDFFYALAGLLGLELLLIVGALLVYCAKRQADDGRNPDSQYKMNQIA